MAITDVDVAVSSAATTAVHQSSSFFFSSAAVETAHHSLVQDVAVTTDAREIADVAATVAANHSFTLCLKRRGRIFLPCRKFTDNLNTYFG